MIKLVKTYYYLLLFSPFFAYIIIEKLDLIPYYFLGSIGTILLVIIIPFKKIIVPKFIYPLVPLFLYYFIWSFYNGKYEEFGLIKMLFKSLSLHTFSFLILAYNFPINSKEKRFFINSFKIFILLSLVITLIQVTINKTFFVATRHQFFNKTTTNYDIRNPSMWGFLSLLDVGLTFIPILAFVLKDELKNKTIYLFLFVLLGAIVSILNNSRWVMLNYAIIIIYLGYTYLKHKNKPNILKYVIIILLVSFSTIKVVEKYAYNITDFYTNRLKSDSASSRLTGLDLFKEYFPQNPWLGTGVRVTKELEEDLDGVSSQIHIGYLSHLYEFGIIGSCILFFFWFKILHLFYKQAKLTNDYVYFTIFVCFLVSNLTLVEYSIYHLGILFAFLMNDYYKSSFQLK